MLPGCGIGTQLGGGQPADDQPQRVAKAAIAVLARTCAHRNGISRVPRASYPQLSTPS
jgi:hypothetical protein